MKALSIRQPWAWLILHAGKDIENRVWRSQIRGRILIHAAKGMTNDEYLDACWSLELARGLQVRMPDFDQLERGGIVGSVTIVDCVSSWISPWFTGPYGFVLEDPQPMPFLPMRGKLGFFEVKIGGVP